MQAHLPAEKLNCIHNYLKVWLQKRKATKRKILSLVGLLQHGTKVIKLGHTFVARMRATAARFKRLYSYIRLNRGFRSDLL